MWIIIKLNELKDKCNQLKIIPQPTRKRRNPDRLEVCADDCIRAIQRYSIDQKKSYGLYDFNLEALIGIKSPMLALLIKHQPEDVQKEIWNDNNYNWRFEKKYNGVRCFISYNNELKKIFIYGRELDNDTLLPKDYTNRFQKIASDVFDLFQAGLVGYSFVIDCELTINDYSKDIIEDILNDPYKDMEAFKYEFNAFDIFSTLRDGTIYSLARLSERINLLEKTMQRLTPYNLPIYLVMSKPDNVSKEDFYKSIIRSGGEGVIAKDLNSSYDFRGKRNGDWTKIKRLNYEGVENLNADTYDLFVSDCIITDNMVSGLELSSYLVNDNNDFIYDRFNNQIPITLGILYDLLPETKKLLTLYDNNGKPYINPRFLDIVVEVRSTGFDDYVNQLQNLKFVCWRLDKNSRDCKFNKDKI